MSEVGRDGRPEDVDSEGYDARLQSVGEIAKQITALHREAELVYAPLVEEILRGRGGDVAQIEHTLDRLLAFCGEARMLLLYRRLCRRLWDLDQSAAVAYVHAYREMYDPAEETDWRTRPLTGGRTDEG